MTKERRNTNKQVTVEKLDKKLDDAISERLKLAEAVEEIHEKVNFDGGLVYQCDLKALKEQNAAEHSQIMEKLNLIFPVVEKQIEESQALDIVINKYLGKTKSVKFWVQFMLMVGVIVVGAGYAVAWVKAFFKGLI